MGMPLQDIREIAVPPEDAALQSAVAQLDRKLTEYAAALRQIAARLQARPESPCPEAASAAAPQAELQAEPQTRVEARKPGVRRLTERTAGKADKVVVPAESATPSPSPSAGPQALAHEEAAEPPLTGDEALLASLDEPTAKAIRVLRRLNPQKSVQELLKQAESHPHEQPAKTANKAWFRFGR